jgi:hypothetical protein
MVTEPSEQHPLVPAHLAVLAMRDNGYRNAAYAAAELIDNSIQAGANTVELIVHEVRDVVAKRARARIDKIAVLDNGAGMDPTLLRKALQFGNGSHLDDRSGIGRFGMGLPSASISQCLHVDVWSWTDGLESANYTYIDIPEVAAGAMTEVPLPKPSKVPAEWQARASSLGDSGTLVVWSQLDRLMWRTGKALMDNSEFVVARMYRKFLANESVRIRMATFEDDEASAKEEWWAKPNDPGYLMSPSSTPSPYDEQAMFQVDGESWEVPHTIDFNGETHTVLVRFSYAKESVRDVRNAGSTDYGRHAAKNIGVSLVRADRELDMDQSFVSTSEARDRWWGVELDFPPALDELFGVANNKQSARNFSELSSKFEALRSSPSDLSDLTQRAVEDDDPQGPLLELIGLIDRRVRLLRNLIKVQNEGADRNRRRHTSDSAEAVATEATRERQNEGLKGQSDADETLEASIRQDQIREELVESGLSEQVATQLAARTIDNGLKYLFTPASLEGRAFFTVSPRAGDIIIKVNTNHPAYENLVEVLDKDVDASSSPEDLVSRLERAQKGLKLLLMAWARLEDEQSSDDMRRTMQDLRTDWGRVADRFLRST